MDLLKIIIDAESLRNTCFLCFKLCETGTNIYDNIDVQDKSIDFLIKTSIWNIVKYLFPLHEIILSKACNDCAEDLKKIYCKFQVRNIKIENLNHIVDDINKNIPEKVPDTKTRIDIHVLGQQISDSGVMENGETSKEFDIKFPKKLPFKRNLLTYKSHGKVCHICGKLCESPKALKSHLNSHNEKPCPYCQKMLKTHAHFNKHVQNHTTKYKRKRKVHNHSCNSCSYRTTNKNDLEAHSNKIHLKIRPHKCEICPKSFCKKSNLTAHLLTHNKKRDLICELCGSDFSVKKTLEQHLKLHEGVRDYQCEFCKRKFVTLSRKNEHVKRNHSDGCFVCPYCVNMYSLKKDLNSHLRRAHSEALLMEQNSFQFMNVIN